MKIRNRKLMAIMVAGILGVSILGGCSDKKESGGASKGASKEEESSIGTVGEFETADIDGNSYTEKVFEDYELTMVNVFATWCSPCVQELPELQKLYEEMTDKGVGVVGIVMDAVDEKGNEDKEGVEKAKVLREQAKITYPLLTPDSGNLNGRLNEIQVFPTTFFVDKTGNIVGQTYEGSGSLEDWRKVVEEELANLRGEE